MDKQNIQWNIQLGSVQLLSHVRLFETPWTVTRQAFLSITNSWSFLKLMSIELVMPSNHLILCRPLLLPPSVFPSIRIYSNESACHIRWPKYWSFSFIISPSSEGFISFRRVSILLPYFQYGKIQFGFNLCIHLNISDLKI